MKFVILFLALILVRNDNGQWNNNPLHDWFNKLANGQGNLCCSFADGITISDVDWDTKDGHYRVKVPAWKYTPSYTVPASDWIVVPDVAVVHEPNRYGPAVVWPYLNNGETAIRCFLPGAGI
jgi:hypothetical protein